MGFWDASDLSSGCVWLDPLWYGRSLVWHHPWPLEIINDLVLEINQEGKLTKSYLELSFLVFYWEPLLLAVLAASMATPRYCLDNTPTIS